MKVNSSLDAVYWIRERASSLYLLQKPLKFYWARLLQKLWISWTTVYIIS